MSFISDNITKNIKPSITLLVDAKANELRAQGYNVISLGVGEPDFDTPDNVKQAAIDAIKRGYTKYTSSGGAKELKTAVVNKFKRENNIEYNENEVCISSGAKQVIYNAFMATLNPGDEVIIISPFWVSYPEMVKISGGIPVIVNSNPSDNFSLNIGNIEKVITPKTKWLLLNSPNNPSGSVYSFQELRSLADMLLNHEHVHILSDDIYEHLIYADERFYNIVEVEPKLKNRTLIVNGASKAYAMTGWRVGYGAGHKDLIKAMMVVQSQSTSGACSISQMAALEALNGSQEFIKKSKEAYINRRNMVVELLNQIAGIKCVLPKGAFYIFVDCSSLFGKKTPQGKVINDSNDVATYLLEQAYVAVVAGSAFGMEGYIRISYATSEANLKECCQRIKSACDLITDDKNL